MLGPKGDHGFWQRPEQSAQKGLEPLADGGVAVARGGQDGVGAATPAGPEGNTPPCTPDTRLVCIPNSFAVF